MSALIAGPSSQPMMERTWPPRLYLAVDCGGTKAAAAVCDQDGHVIGKGRGGPSNFTDEGLQSFLLNVEDAITDALDSVKRHYKQEHNNISWHCSKDTIDAAHPPPSNESSKLDTDYKSKTTVASALEGIQPAHNQSQPPPKVKLTAAWFGIAGVDSPADVTTLSPHLARMLDLPYPSTRLIVANDTSLLAAPITDSSRPDIKSGVVAISGTGSIVMSFKRSQSGMLKVLGRIGGFGWVLGDEGSGYSVGRAAVRKVLDIADREKLARDWDNGESDSEEEDEGIAAPLSHGVDYDAEMSGRMSRSSLNDESIGSASTQPSSLLTTETNEGKEDTTAQKSDDYGQQLRDRILQEWGLVSTDELLRAVYFDDAPPSSTTTANFSQNFPGVPTIIQSGSNPDQNQPLSDVSASVKDALAQAEPSLNLLPPAGAIFDKDARSCHHSPLQSLSSSPSNSSSTAIHFSSPIRASNGNRSDSAISTNISSTVSSFITTPDPHSPTSTSEKKHRLASLAPLVFHLAFSHADQLCLEILRSQARLIALQIRDILLIPSSQAKAHLSSDTSVLCLGGGLVGQAGYRHLLLEELQKLDISFAAVEFVSNPATRGAIALSTGLGATKGVISLSLS